MLHDIVSIPCAAGYTGEMRSKNKAKHLFSWIALWLNKIDDDDDDDNDAGTGRGGAGQGRGGIEGAGPGLARFCM